MVRHRRLTRAARLVLAACVTPKFGYELMQLFAMRSGAVYPLLARMRTLGYLSATNGGRPLGGATRILYTLTEAGQRALEDFHSLPPTRKRRKRTPFLGDFS